MRYLGGKPWDTWEENAAFYNTLSMSTPESALKSQDNKTLPSYPGHLNIHSLLTPWKGTSCIKPSTWPNTKAVWEGDFIL